MFLLMNATGLFDDAPAFVEIIFLDAITQQAIAWTTFNNVLWYRMGEPVNHSGHINT